MKGEGLVSHNIS